MAKPKTAKKAALARRHAPTKVPDGGAAVKAYIAALPGWKKAAREPWRGFQPKPA